MGLRISLATRLHFPELDLLHVGRGNVLLVALTRNFLGGQHKFRDLKEDYFIKRQQDHLKIAHGERHAI